AVVAVARPRQPYQEGPGLFGRARHGRLHGAALRPLPARPAALVSRVQSLFASAWSRWRLAAFSLAHVTPLRGLAAALPCIQRSSGIRQRTSDTRHERAGGS